MAGPGWAAQDYDRIAARFTEGLATPAYTAHRREQRRG